MTQKVSLYTKISSLAQYLTILRQNNFVGKILILGTRFQPLCSACKKKLSYTHLFFLFIYVTDFLLDLLLPEIMGGETQGDFFITESYVAGP